MNPDAYVPMPDTHHPRYEDDAASLRAYLRDGGRTTIVLAAPNRLRSYKTDPTASYPVESLDALRIRLERRKLVGPSPHVGKGRAFLVWHAYVDSVGRHVAGPAERVVKNEELWYAEHLASPYARRDRLRSLAVLAAKNGHAA